MVTGAIWEQAKIKKNNGRFCNSCVTVSFFFHAFSHNIFCVWIAPVLFAANHLDVVNLVLFGQIVQRNANVLIWSLTVYTAAIKGFYRVPAWGALYDRKCFFTFKSWGRVGLGGKLRHSAGADVSRNITNKYNVKKVRESPIFLYER